LLSCHLPYRLIEAPEEVRLRAWQEAEKYIGMEYEWGGQDFYDTRGIDCSGLVVNCYLRAVERTDCFLLFSDTSVPGLLDKYSTPIENPERGDLLFMGETGISHIAIFERIDAGVVCFIDAYSETGLVERRSYPVGNYKIKSFGRLIVGKHR
jgi:hypothetical protein